MKVLMKSFLLSRIAVAVLASTLVAPMPVLVSSTAQAAASRLGDLSPFRTIASDTLDLVKQGNLPAATTRIKDLEVAWDDAEAGLKPRAASDWHVVDRAIDRALNALRVEPSGTAQCQQALEELLQTMDKMSGAA